MTAVRLEQKGRGRALRTVWSLSEAPVLAYMDVDLSTDLKALLPLVAPLISGHSDLAIGSRLARSSRTVGVLYAAVRRRFSAAAGLIAGAALAVTPVAALMFRFNNPDALLCLLMVSAVLLRAARAGGRPRTKWLLLAGVCSASASSPRPCRRG
ncbi:hypothetical protein SANTM175S_01770 [Streptomyces antimycoticus]